MWKVLFKYLKLYLFTLARAGAFSIESVNISVWIKMFSYPTEKLMRRSSGSRGQKWFNINRKKIRGYGKITRSDGSEVIDYVLMGACGMGQEEGRKRREGRVSSEVQGFFDV